MSKPKFRMKILSPHYLKGIFVDFKAAKEKSNTVLFPVASQLIVCSPPPPSPPSF